MEETGEFADEPNLLDRHLLQLCAKHRFLPLIHDFIVFDAGIKKVCRQNQYFGVVAAQEFIRRREGGIIWHTQGSGKSLTMVWLATWIRETVRVPACSSSPTAPSWTSRSRRCSSASARTSTARRAGPI
ncbi:MAG: hypothetical protein O9339_15545 [Rubrivivax sp.]|nr:hypothetical protein [Rubrivivax sp.]